MAARIGRLRLAALATVVAALALPASGQASYSRFGSDLTAPANMVEAHGADSAFWSVELQHDIAGTAMAAPAEGQVTELKVKGSVIPNPDPNAPRPMTMFHFQVLRPQSDGTVKVWLSSGAFYTPLGGDPQQVNSYRPINLCVHKGDIVDFNDIGGSEWWWQPYQGMPFQVFSRVPGSTTNFYSKDNGTNNGDQWAPAETHQGQELLMQMVLATGPDSTDTCPGGYSQHVFKGLDVRARQSAILRTLAREARVRATCPSNTYGACIGTLRLDATVKGRRLTLGTAPFRVLPATSVNVHVGLPAAAVRTIQKAGRIVATATADSHDDRNAATWPIGTQSKTTSTTVTLTPDRTLKAGQHKKPRKRRHR